MATTVIRLPGVQTSFQPRPGNIESATDRALKRQAGEERALRILDLKDQQEKVKRDRQSLSDFVIENIRLGKENPTMDPELVTQQALSNVQQKDPLTSTAVTDIIAERELGRPTGIRRELIKAQIESSQSLAASRTGADVREPGELTNDQKRRKSLASTILTIDNSKDPGKRSAQRQEAVKLMGELPKEALLNIKDATSKQIDIEFGKAMDNVDKKLRINTKGNIFNQMWGEAAYKQGLKKAQEQALADGADPDTVLAVFNKWWDLQAEDSGLSREFQPRSEFQTATEGEVDVSQLTDEALDKLIEAGK